MALYIRQFRDIDSELDLMREYVMEITLSLTTSKKKLYEKILKKIGGMPKDEAQQYASDHYVQDLSLSEFFPALHTSWTFVAIMSFVEHQMIRLCKALQEEDKSELGVGDLQGRGIEVCKIYLKKIHQMDLTKIDEWPTILRLQDLRNVIVHRLGHLEEPGTGKQKGKDDDIHKFFERRSDVKVDEFRGIVFTHDFCLEAVEVARGFLKKVMDLIPERFFGKNERAQ